MKNVIGILIFFLFTLSLASMNKEDDGLQKIDEEIHAGNFSVAKGLIRQYGLKPDLSENERYLLHWEEDLMHRLALDFSKSKEEILESLRKYYPAVDDVLLAQWEENRKLEYMTIEGEKKYFHQSVANLFLLDKNAGKRKREIDKTLPPEKTETLLKNYLPEVEDSVEKRGKAIGIPKRFKVKYTVTLQANAVPAGEIVRCWLPYPRKDCERQTEVRLLSANDSNYILSPESYAHRSLYMEKKSVEGEPTVFSIEFSYRSAPEWHDLTKEKIKAYDKNSELYKEYTSERPPHIVFDDSIRSVSERIVGNVTDPYEKVKRIFGWISKNFTWASSREYSTIPNIPAYVLKNRHGDCGQVTLLFLSLARYNGIPARWQSGFMTYPEGVDLHDWGEYYLEGIGWIPVDQSFGVKDYFNTSKLRFYFSSGTDAYRLIVNSDYSRDLFPSKIYPRSETVDFQRGELEWKGGNLYFDKWKWSISVSPIQ